MHYNLLFNGCSFTAGSELQGKENNLEYRDQHRFSQVISNKTGLSHKNIAIGGSSNDRITRTTIDWFRKNTCDTAIIQFTAVQRMEYISPYAKHPVNFVNGPNKVGTKWKSNSKHDHEETKQSYHHYYKYVYNNNLGFYNFYKNLYILEQFFKSNHINYCFIKLEKNNSSYIALDKCKLSIHDDDGDLLDFYWKSVCKNKYTSITSICGNILKDFSSDYTTDYTHEGYPLLQGGHPSEIGHEKIANHIIKEIDSAL